MKNSSGLLYLISSNASKEYISDALETLSSPLGLIMHYRYQTRWIGTDLKDQLPIRGKGITRELRNTKVAACYLYQEENQGQQQWVDIYPIRIGILIDAYKTGNEDTDVAHFYFKVENYISYDGQNWVELLTDTMGEKFGKFYAFLGPSFEDAYIVNKENSKSAFFRICESLKPEHLRSPAGREYQPLFCFIEGLRDEKGEFLAPKYDPLSYKSFYELREGDRHSFEFGTYFIKKTKKVPQFVVKLLSDRNIFSTPAEYELKGASRYDGESWVIISSLLKRDIWTIISFRTELINNINSKEPLNTHTDFAIKIKKKQVYRIIDFLSDLGFAVGTGSIALAKMVEQWGWWYYPVIIGYVVFAVCKLIIKLWRE